MLILSGFLPPDCRLDVISIRPGEKLHEVMVPGDESRKTYEYDTQYVIAPAFHDWTLYDHAANGGRKVADGFNYASDTNDHWLTVDELREMAGEPAGLSIEAAPARRRTAPGA